MTFATKPSSQKICKTCRRFFTPFMPMAVVCGPSCALSLAVSKSGKDKKVAETKDRKDTREKLLKHKTKAAWIREAQSQFNAYIRARDRLAGHCCISSGKPLDWTGNAVDAGHYRSRGSAPHLRFDERNCHAQSKHDNRYGSGNVVGYRLGLIERLGLAAVEALEVAQAGRNYSVDDLMALKALYRAKTKALEKLG